MYVTNSGSKTVSVIDTAANKVIAIVNVGTSPRGIAITPDGKEAYVTDLYSNKVSVIDTITNTLTYIVPVGIYPHGIVVTPDGKKVYVANGGSNNVSVIDAATKTVTATVTNVGTFPWGVTITSDGKKVYVTSEGSGTVSAIDTDTNTVTSTVPVGANPFGAAVSPDGTKVYVTMPYNNTVSVIATATNKVIATVPVGNFPYGITITPDGTKVYVANYDSDNVSVIATATNHVKATVDVGSTPMAFGQFIGHVPASVPVLPIANFVTNVSEGYSPLTVQFTDLSTNSTSVNWDFGDKSNSTERNPVHEYSDPGIYTVNLTASNENGIDLKSATITVTEKSLIPVTAFSASPTSGKAPLKVAFIDKSAGSPTKWKWSFGDGKTSTVQNPTYKYSNLGNYTVSLTATNAEGNSTTIKTDYIKVVTKPVANFSAKPTSGKAPLDVAFTDTSTGVLAGWIWDFGDGSKSFLQSPIHKYSKAGIYTVNLAVKNAAGHNTVTKTDYIKVVTKPVA
uniref:PKD domain-containing protein n=1 Tax=Methanosarcina spelaei TaxID=1036679 RepID=UPI001FEC9B79